MFVTAAQNCTILVFSHFRTAQNYFPNKRVFWVVLALTQFPTQSLIITNNNYDCLAIKRKPSLRLQFVECLF